jgi:tetratricopeptide (TPR) repeat protein
MSAPDPLDQPARHGDTEILLPISFTRDPQQIGPYRILAVIGRGGMGVVYRAVVVAACEVPIGTEVAIKLLTRIDDRHERMRFTREANYLQALRHPGIVRVLSAGEHGDQPYLVMQLLAGQPLNEYIAGGPLSEAEVIDIGIQSLEALHTAHLAGILHRDVKPGNIMLTPDGSARLLDFGLAHRLDGQSTLTATGAVVGTPAYMSPEQAAGERNEFSRRSDIYSLGACCYEMVTGCQPFRADNSVALLRLIIDQPLTPPSVLRPDISPDLEAVVMTAMAKHPADRYPTAEHMAEDLRRMRRGQRVRATRPGWLRPLLRTAWHNRRAIAALGLVAFLAVATLGIGVRRALAARGPGPSSGDWQLIDAAWVDEWNRDPQQPLRRRAYAPLGKGIELATLPAVHGPVRLHADVTPVDAGYRVELMVGDRDVGRGYRLRLASGESGEILTLLREDKIVASRAVATVPAGQPMRLRLERIDDAVVGELVGEPPLSFVDLAPIDGADADGVHLAFDPATTRVDGVRLERQRSGLYVSALAPADLLRQDGRYARAIQAYETFLRDHPESPLVREARFRIGLCHEALTDDEQALAAYVAVAREYRDSPHHVLAATFRAWGCSLRLGRYQEAEQYFEAIRRQHDLAALLASVPEETLHTLIADYFARGAALAVEEPLRAVHLWGTGADLAEYLGLPDRVATGTTGAAAILLGTGRVDEAIARWRDLARRAPSDAIRAAARLHIGHAERLRGNPELARSLYEAVAADIATPEEQLQWARFWLGDLLFEMGDRAAALDRWKASSERESLPGRLMQHLLHGNRPLPLEGPAGEANDIEYANARLARLRGLDQQYFDRLANCARLGTVHDWPSPLARRLAE